jgi:predicted nuclease with TOPRIM domain
MDTDTERRLTEVEERAKSNTHQIEELKKRQDDLDDLVAAVATVKTEQGHIQTDLREIKADVKSLTGKSGRRWDSLVDKLLLLLAGGFISWLALGAPGL